MVEFVSHGCSKLAQIPIFTRQVDDSTTGEMSKTLIKDIFIISVPFFNDKILSNLYFVLETTSGSSGLSPFLIISIVLYLNSPSSSFLRTKPVYKAMVVPFGMSTFANKPSPDPGILDRGRVST
jgi:hypothetical protein